MMTVPGGAWCGVVVAVVLAAGACGGNQRAPRPATSPTASKAADSAIDGAERAVRAAFASHVGDGAGVIALVRVGKNTRVITLGMADVAARRPLKPDDRFPIASITKSVVATAVLQYVASGRAKLDDPVDRFLPGLLPSRKITIRQLLGHRSGLHQLNGDEVPPGDPPSPLAIIRAVARHPLDYAPGTDGAYLNEGYTVLGVLLEKLSRRPLRSVLNDAVFNRAGMTSTALSGEPTVQGYSAYRIGQVAEPPPLDLAWAAGGVVSTVADVDRFYAQLWSGDLLKKELVDQMRTNTGFVPFGVGTGYGLGVWITSTGCGEALGHGGSIEGFETRVLTVADNGRSVVVMVNTADGSIADNVAEAALCG